MRHSHECRATAKLDRKSRICRINVYSMRLQRESCVYIVYLCREIVVNYLRISLQLSHSSEIGALDSIELCAMYVFCLFRCFMIHTIFFQS